MAKHNIEGITLAKQQTLVFADVNPGRPFVGTYPTFRLDQQRDPGYDASAVQRQISHAEPRHSLDNNLDADHIRETPGHALVWFTPGSGVFTKITYGMTVVGLQPVAWDKVGA